MSVGPAEILVILVVGLLVFGPHRLPEVGRQVGAALRELRRMQDSVRGELDMVLHPEHGTRSSGAPATPFEPDDHSLIDPASPTIGSGDIGSGDTGSSDAGSGDVSSVEIAPTDDPGFAGPSGSFT
jgi:TatA/E family protein of Tat protein translocase